MITADLLPIGQKVEHCFETKTTCGTRSLKCYIFLRIIDKHEFKDSGMAVEHSEFADLGSLKP
jgi:hypothetical protein